MSLPSSLPPQQPAPQVNWSQWKALLPLLTGLPLLPCGAKPPQCKAPVDPLTGNGLKDWQTCVPYLPEQILSMNGHVLCAGMRTGDDGLLVVDIDGSSGVRWLLAVGVDPDAIDTWQVGRTTSTDRYKLVFRLTPEQRKLFPNTKLLLRFPPAEGQTKGDALEVYYQNGAQVVVLGEHRASGGWYCWRNSPADIAAPDEAMFAALLALKVEVEKLRGSGGGTKGAGLGKRSRKAAAGEWRESSPQQRCPVCGRDHSGACGIHRDGNAVSCYEGGTFTPPEPEGGWIPGKTITGFDGRVWAYLKPDYISGLGHKRVFKIHEPLLEQQATTQAPTFDHTPAVRLLADTDYPTATAEEFNAAAIAGRPLVVVANPCGSGKTMQGDRLVQLLLDLPDVDHVIFVSRDYRNLPCNELMAYAVPPVRHRDTVLDEVNGSDIERLRRRDEATTPMLVVDPMTCIYAWSFAEWSKQGGSNDATAGFCRDCSYQAGCPYLDRRSRFLAAWQQGDIATVRCSVGSLNFLWSTAGEDQWRRTALVFDEAPQLADAGTTQYCIPLPRFDDWAQHIRLQDGIEHQGLLLELMALLRDAHERMPAADRLYGQHHGKAMQYIKHWNAKVDALFPSRLPESWVNQPQIIDIPDPEAELTVTQPLLLPALLQAVRGVSGSLSITKDGITIYRPSQTLQDAFSDSAGAVVLDATTSPDSIRRYLAGPHPAAFRAIRTSDNTGLDQITFVQIPDLGVMGKQRGDNQKKRKEALINAIRAEHSIRELFGELPAGRTGKVGVIDIGKHASEGEGAWYSASRGSNAFRTDSGLVLIGLPSPNLTAARSEFAAHHPGGTDDDFKAHYADIQGKELIQGISRLRPADATGAGLVVYLVTNADLSGMGLPITTRTAESFCPWAGDKHSQTIAQASATLDHTFDRSTAIPQRALCDAAGISRTNLTRALQERGWSYRDLLLCEPWRWPPPWNCPPEP